MTRPLGVELPCSWNLERARRQKRRVVAKRECRRRDVRDRDEGGASYPVLQRDAMGCGVVPGVIDPPSRASQSRRGRLPRAAVKNGRERLRRPRAENHPAQQTCRISRSRVYPGHAQDALWIAVQAAAGKRGSHARRDRRTADE